MDLGSQDLLQVSTLPIASSYPTMHDSAGRLQMYPQVKTLQPGVEEMRPSDDLRTVQTVQTITGRTAHVNQEIRPPELESIRPPQALHDQHAGGQPQMIRPVEDVSSKKVVRYRECRKNHAATIGGYAIDGCGEFMASGDEGTSAAMQCAACNCHRNFHRREVEGDHGPPCDCQHTRTR